MLNFLNNNFVRISRSIVWFNRFTGVTYGGFDFDSKGRLFVNKFWKYYGYFNACSYLAFEMTMIYYLSFGNSENTSQFVGGSFTRYTLLVLSTLVRLQKTYIMYFINCHGYNLSSIVYYKLRMYSGLTRKINAELCWIFTIWLSHTIIILCMEVYLMLKSTSSLFLLAGNFEFLVTMYTAWIAPTFMWAVSAYCGNLLDYLYKHLSKCVTSIKVAG